MTKPRAIWIVAGGLVAAVVVAIIAVSLLEIGDGTPSGSPVVLSESELLEEVDSLGQPVYWAGPQPDTEGFELETASDGSISLRYVPKGAEADDPRSGFLMVGTYPVAEAQNALLNAKNSGKELTLSEYDGYEVLNGAPESAYVVFYSAPTLQIEVYSLKPGEASQLANAGVLTPLG